MNGMQTCSAAPKQHVLVVEDDPALANLLVTLLDAAGYDTTLAADEPSARAAAQGARIDLLLSDVVLGVCDGLDIESAVRQAQPGVRVLFMSGYGTSKYGHTANDPVLAKPFTPADLLLRVRKAMTP
jgi:DNA-binding response OmpR family regulator